MRSRGAFLAALLAFGAGCGLVAGVQDIAYGDPAPGTSTSPTEPSDVVEGGAASVDEASAPTTTDGAVTAPDDATAAADAAVALDAAEPPDAADAGADAGDDDDDDDPVGGGAGCKAADFAANDRRAPLAARIILFPVAGPPPAYSPRCMMIRAGQSVTWQGDLAVDPLEPRSQNPASPITLTAAGNAVTFTFAKKGRYRYGSTAQPLLRGAIDVRP